MKTERKKFASGVRECIQSEANSERGKEREKKQKKKNDWSNVKAESFTNFITFFNFIVAETNIVNHIATYCFTSLYLRCPWRDDIAINYPSYSCIGLYVSKLIVKIKHEKETLVCP